MLSIVRKNKSDNDIKELNLFYEHDVYESAKREANGHIDMLSNMSNSGQSVLDDASYTELEKYFDVNAVYAPDGRVLSGGEVLLKYGVTSASSGEIAKNSDTDGLAAIIMDQLDNQKKSPRDEFYDELSPYVTETENARLFYDEAKEIFNTPDGIYQSDYKDRYDYSEVKYSGVQGDNRGIISYLEAVETAAKDPNYIKRLIAAEYLAQKQLASSDHSASMAIESHSADMSDAADISYSEQTSNSVENISVDNSAENGIIETKTSDARSDIKDVVEIYLSKSSYPESAQHILDAISAGQPDVLTIDREGATANRGEALDGYEKSSEFDLDEYPPAMFKEGGKGASVRAISRSDNRGAGSKIGHQLRKYPNGTKVKIIITD